MKSARLDLVHGSLIVTVSMVTAAAISMLTSIVIVRSLSVADFGIYSITLSLQSVVAIIASFGIGTAVAKFVAEYSARDLRQAVRFARTGLWLILLFSTITAIAYFTLARPIGEGLYHEAGVVNLIPFSAMVVISSATQSLTQNIAQGNHRMKMISSIQISTPAIRLILILILMPIIGISGAFLSLFLAQITITLMAIRRLGRTGFSIAVHEKDDSNIQYAKIILSFAVPTVLGALLVSPFYWFGNTILELGYGFTAVGQFSIALIFFQALNLLSYSVAIPLVPRVSEMSVHSRGQIGPLISQSLRSISVILFPFFLAISLFSKDIIGILFGSQYQNSADATYLMVTACFFVSLAAILEATIIGLGRMWLDLGLNGIWAIIFIPLILIMTPLYGITGLGAAFALAYAAHLFNILVVSNKILGLKIGDGFSMICLTVISLTIAFILLEFMGGLTIIEKSVIFIIFTAPVIFLGRSEIRVVYKALFNR